MTAPNRPSWNWWFVDGDPHAELIQWANRVREDDQPRKYRMCELLCLYSNTAYEQLAGAMNSGAWERISENHIENMIHTVHAEAVQNRTRMTVVTSGGDYQMKRRAKKLEKLSEGQAYEDDQEEVGNQCKLDALVWGTGVEKCLINPATGRVEGERTLSWELHGDQSDARYGKPQNLGQTHVFDRDVLKACYPKKADEIEQAPRGAIDDYPFTADGTSNLVVVSEAWHLPSKPADPRKEGDEGSGDGRHAIAIPGATLLDEPWTKSTFPFVFIHWLRPMIGMWGKGMVEQLLGQQIEHNRAMRHIQLSMKRAGNLKVFIDTNSGVLKTHINDRVGTMITYNGQGGHEPKFIVHDVVSPQVIQWAEGIGRRMYNVEGISQMASQGQLDKGLDKASGRAIRMADSIQGKRRLPFMRDCETFDRKVAELKVDLIREAQEQNGGSYAVQYRGKKSIELIDLKDVNLSRDEYWFRVFPTSSLPSEPSAKIATLDEWLNGGLISKSDYKRLADFPDLEDASTLETAQYDLGEQIVELMLYEGKSYVVEELQDKKLFAQIALSMYTRAKLEGLADKKAAYPEEHMELVRQFIIDCIAPPPPDPSAIVEGGAPGTLNPALGLAPTAATAGPGGPAPGAPPAPPPPAGAPPGTPIM